MVVKTVEGYWFSVVGYARFEVWQKATDLCEIGYWKSETYGLTAQLRHSVTSILPNIAERSAGGTKKNLSIFDKSFAVSL